MISLSQLSRSLTPVVPLTLLGLAACAPEPEAPFVDEAYRREISEWQAGRQAGLSDPEGWRALVGLDWLESGETTVGGQADNDVVLDTENAPSHIGTFTVKDPKGESAADAGAPEVWFRPAEGVEVTANGEAVSDEILLATDLEDDTTVLEVGSLALHVIEREEDDKTRVAVRSRDREHPRLDHPPEIAFFPVDPAWRFEARFDRYEPPRESRIVNVLGMISWEPLVGALVFEKDGTEHRLDVLESGDELFVIFGDLTNGDTTYGSGRYLYTDNPLHDDTVEEVVVEEDPVEDDPVEDDAVIVDFNRAYNPPCAFTDFATCPLPPPQNRLPIAVTAGARYESSYGGQEEHEGGHG